MPIHSAAVRPLPRAGHGAGDRVREAARMNYWLFKSEPDTYGFDRLQREGRTEWSGVRNFQARNNMKAMQVGDLGFFYHSSTKVPGIAGICRVVRTAYPDPTAFDSTSDYYDPKSNPEKPVWKMVDVAYEAAVPRFVSLAELRGDPQLAEMVLLRRSRLSVQPVTTAQWRHILKIAAEPELRLV
ncbi:MAG: EVE domain-containing protein [Vulcanimicrobiaceae bacterium]